MTHEERDRWALEEALASASLIARRLAKSRERVGSHVPIDEAALGSLSDGDEEAIETLLFRYVSLLGIVQDQIFRAILKVQEEEVRERTRKDQRLFMEKIGALPPEIDFGALAATRNRVTHQYPDRRERQARVINEVFERAADLLAAHRAVESYARKMLLEQRDASVARPGDPP